MLWNAFRFFRGIFAYSSGKRYQRELHEDLRNEAKLQRALAEGNRHALSRLEQEMRAADQEAKD